MNDPETIVVEDRAQDRLVKGLQFGTAVLTVIVLVLAGMTLPAALSGADNSSRVQESTDIAACRALARVPIDEARTEIESLILDGLTAAAVGALDPAVLARADTAQAALVAATSSYKASIELSTADPEAFLEQCRETRA